MTRMFLLLAASLTSLLPAAELKPETLAEWDRYIARHEARMRGRLAPGNRFLWSDEAPGRASRVRAGEILVEPLGSGARRVAGGLIHHWVGAAFIGNTTLERVLAVTHDYERYHQIYGPQIARSKLMASGASSQEYRLVLLNKVLSVTAALQGEYESRDFPVDGRRWYQITRSTKVQDVLAFGKQNESLAPAGRGTGYVWRLQNIARYEERDGGVYLEMEALALSRDIPAAWRWLVTPAISRLSRTSVARSLHQTRCEVQCGSPAITSLD